MAFLPPTAIPLPGLHQAGSRMTMHVSQMAALPNQLPEVCSFLVSHKVHKVKINLFRNDLSNRKRQFVT